MMLKKPGKPAMGTPAIAPIPQRETATQLTLLPCMLCDKGSNFL